LFYGSLTKNNTLYYTNLIKRNIFKAYYNEGNLIAEDAGIEFGGHATVAKDESFIVFDYFADTLRNQNDIFIAFKDKQGKWTNPISLSSQINTTYSESCPTLSPDEKYLFFSRFVEDNSSSDIYWVKIDEIIKQLNYE